MTKLQTLIEELQMEMTLEVDGYGEETFLKRDGGFYTVSVLETSEGFELGTFKDMNSEEIANEKTVKTIKAVKTYLNKFLGC